MSKSGAIRAGEAYTELHADKTPMERELKLGEAVLKRFGEKISGLGEKLVKVGGSVLGIEGIAAIFEKLRGAAEPTAELLKLGQQTGMTVEAIGELRHAAKSAGVDLETLVHSTGHMQKFLVEAAMGSGEAKFALSQLGLTVASLARLPVDKQLEKIGAQLMRIPDPAVRTAVAMQVLGKSGAELIPIFAKGTGWMAAQRAEAITLGRKTREQAEEAKAFGDAMDKLFGSISSITGALVGALGPAVKLVADYVNPIAQMIGRWIRENKALVTSLSLAALAVFGAGAALLSLGPLVAKFGTLFAAGISLAISVAGSLWAMLLGIGPAIMGAFGVLGTVIAAIASPVGVALAVVLALGIAITTSAGGFGKATGWILDSISELKTAFQNILAYFTPAWQGIKDALSSGDLSLAFRIVGAQIKVEWVKALAVLEGQWVMLKTNLVVAAVDAGTAIAQAFVSAFGMIEKAWIEIEGFITKGALRIAAMIEKKGALTPNEAAGIDFGINMTTGIAKQGVDQRTAATNAGIGLAGSQVLAGVTKAGLDERGKTAIASLLAISGAQQDLDKLIAQAAAEKNKGKTPPGGGPPIADRLSGLAEIVRTHGVAGQDVRTAEGFKSFAASLRVARDNPQKQAAQTLASLLVTQKDAARDIRKTRELAEQDVGFAFQGGG